MQRDEPIWYYRLGDQTLGPVTWAEIERLTEDTVPAEDLLVARGGDAGWRPAADVMTRSEVPASGTAPDRAEARTGGGFEPKHGLGRWLDQAWRMVIDEIGVWVGAGLLMFFVSVLTLGILGPPLWVGYYRLALKRFRGQETSPMDVFEGMPYFLPAWGLALINMIPTLVLLAPMFGMIAFMIVSTEAGGAPPDELMPFMMMGWWLVYPVIYALMLAIQAILFYAWVLIAEDYGAWEAVVASWEKVSADFWSYLGMSVLLTVIAGLGVQLCYLGGLITYPLLPCAQVAAYMWHFGRR